MWFHDCEAAVNDPGVFRSVSSPVEREKTELGREWRASVVMKWDSYPIKGLTLSFAGFHVPV